jgi:hypothetical protein
MEISKNSEIGKTNDSEERKEIPPDFFKKPDALPNKETSVSEETLKDLNISREQYNKIREEGKCSDKPYEEVMPPLNEPTSFRYSNETGFKGQKDEKYIDGLTAAEGGKQPGTWKDRAEGNRDFMAPGNIKNNSLIPEARRQELYKSYDDLAKGKIGIPYKDGYLDLSKFAYFITDIRQIGYDRISEYRYREKNPDKDRGMYMEADKALDKQMGWPDGTTKQFREGNDLTWHEREDLTTLELVPMDIHNNNDVLWHTGGHSIVKTIVGRGD